MHFRLIDRVIELCPERVVAVKSVSASEEYLQDHFPTFPVLPGVFMIEALVQAARELLRSRDPSLARHVLGTVRALKYASFVRPGETLRLEVTLLKEEGDTFSFAGTGTILRPDAGDATPPQAVSGRFTMRPPRIGSDRGDGAVDLARESVIMEPSPQTSAPEENQ